MQTVAHLPVGTDGGIYQSNTQSMEQDQLTAKLIWSNVSQFVKAREKAYHFLVGQGIEVPDFAQKCRAIKTLQSQLEASRTWSLLAQVRWIHAMRPMIATLLPMEDHPQARLRTYRRRILHLLNYCDALCSTQRQLTIQPCK
jgi:hypothetical protein